MVECSNLHCNRWVLLHKAWAADVLTSHQETTIVQGFYVHRLSVLAQSKKVVGAIIVVSGQTVLLHLRSQEYSKICCTVYSSLSFNLGAGSQLGSKGSGRNIIPCLWHLDWWSPVLRALAYEPPLRFIPHYLNDITLQIWNVGGVLCDIIIAVCMTYYVCFMHFSLLSSEGNQISFLFDSFRNAIPLSKLPKPFWKSLSASR